MAKKKIIRDSWTAPCFILSSLLSFFSSVAQSCPTLCDPMNRSMPDLPVHHQLPEFTQTHVNWVGDVIQPSNLLSSPSPPASDPSLLSKGLSTVFSNTTSSKASILQHSAFFIVQFSHPQMTTGKTIALTRWIFVGKVISLLFNLLSRLVFLHWGNYSGLSASWTHMCLFPSQFREVLTGYFFKQTLYSFLFIFLCDPHFYNAAIPRRDRRLS